VIAALLSGAGLGLGLVAVARGLWPHRAPLAVELARLDHRPAPAPLLGVAASLGRWRRGLGVPLAAAAEATGLRLASLRADLAITGRSLEAHLAEKVALGVLGLALAPATAAVMALGGAHLPWAVPAWAAVVLGVVFFFAPDVGVRAEAAERRRDVRHALGSFLDLVVVGLAGGSGVEGALDDAAGVGSGWAHAQIRHALGAARVTGETPWSALARLGGELGVSELAELAASVGLAGSEGAKVRQSLAAKAASLRTHALADAEEHAESATEAMSLPVVLLFAGFLVFVAFPALARVLAGF
jgi:tight adherence protein C